MTKVAITEKISIRGVPARRGPSPVPQVAGEFFGLTPVGSSRDLQLQAIVPSTPETVNLDDAFQRRRDVDRLLRIAVPEYPCMAASRRKAVGLCLVRETSAMDSDLEPERLIRRSAINTQRLFDQRIGAGSTVVPISPQMPGYRHTALFSRVYGLTVDAIREMLERCSQEHLVVVDLGAGECHMAATLGVALTPRELARVQFICVDRDEARLARGRKLLAERAPTIRADFLTADVVDPAFHDRLRRMNPHITTAHHVVEHLDGDIRQLALHPWLHATRGMMIVSVPLRDDPNLTISDHRALFDEDSVESLAHEMSLRVAFAATPRHVQRTRAFGAFVLERVANDLSRTPVVLTPGKSVRADPADGVDFAQRFSLEGFRRNPVARLVGRIENRREFSRRDVCPRQARQLPIKMPGSRIILPGEFCSLAEAIQLCIDHNSDVNPDFDDSYVYLNFFSGKTLTDAYRGLSESAHGDQLQGLDERYWYKPDYSYISSSTLPTTFFKACVDLDDAAARARAGEKVNVYRDFTDQVATAKRYRSRNYCIYLLSPYVIHAATPARWVRHRTFLKVAISKKRYFDNRELRRNPAFDYEDWFQQDTLSHRSGWLSHGHHNEYYIADDVLAEGRR